MSASVLLAVLQLSLNGKTHNASPAPPRNPSHAASPAPAPRAAHAASPVIAPSGPLRRLVQNASSAPSAPQVPGGGVRPAPALPASEGCRRGTCLPSFYGPGFLYAGTGNGYWSGGSESDLVVGRGGLESGERSASPLLQSDTGARAPQPTADPNAPDTCTPDESAPGANPPSAPEATLYRWVDAQGTVNYADADSVPEAVRKVADKTTGEAITVQPALKCHKAARAGE